MQAGVADPGGWYAGRSGRGTAVSDPIKGLCHKMIFLRTVMLDQKFLLLV
jgi:hypothetical protein